MRPLRAEVPTRLRNGDILPRKFSEVCAIVRSTPRYKVVVFSIDTFSKYYQLVHIYYVSLLGEDPSRLRAQMAAWGREPLPSGWEDGKSVENMLVYRIYRSMNDMPEVAGVLARLIQDNKSAYAMKSFYNLVQRSFDEDIVL